MGRLRLRNKQAISPPSYLRMSFVRRSAWYVILQVSSRRPHRLRVSTVTLCNHSALQKDVCVWLNGVGVLLLCVFRVVTLPNSVLEKLVYKRSTCRIYMKLYD